MLIKFMHHALLGCGFTVLIATRSACAQTGDRFAITRSVIGSGGATAAAGNRFTMNGTAGQPLAAAFGGGRFAIQSGFWIAPSPILFAPSKVGATFLVSIQSELGKTYTLQYMNALGTNWQSLSPIVGNGKIITVTNAGSGASQRFFRLVEK